MAKKNILSLFERPDYVPEEQAVYYKARDQALGEIDELLKSFGEDLESPTGGSAAIRWYDKFDFQPDEVRDWLAAGVNEPDVAELLQFHKISADEAALMVGPEIGRGHYTATIGYKVSNGDLDVEDVVAMFKSAGWRNNNVKKKNPDELKRSLKR